MSILLHSCCGPCLSGSYPILEQDTSSQRVAVFWENPNIHPFLEYYQRLDSLKKMAGVFDLEIFYGDDSYGLNRFLNALAGDFSPARCALCYKLRLKAVAKAAAENSFAAFSTTLLISPYQDHELLVKTGLEVAEQTGVKFFYADFRPGFKNSHEMARKHELYRQKYCGCIFSEHERYRNDKKYLNLTNQSGVK